jgi:hypothetical protein
LYCLLFISNFSLDTIKLTFNKEKKNSCLGVQTQEQV